MHGGLPVLFYVIEANDSECVRYILQLSKLFHNMNNAKGVPALALAAMRSMDTVVNPLEVFKTLLSYGASPEVIPENMWQTYIDQSPSIALDRNHGKSKKAKGLTTWCTEGYRDLLARGLHPSLRYCLCKASTSKPAASRELQVVQAKK